MPKKEIQCPKVAQTNPRERERERERERAAQDARKENSAEKNENEPVRKKTMIPKRQQKRKHAEVRPASDHVTRLQSLKSVDENEKKRATEEIQSFIEKARNKKHDVSQEEEVFCVTDGKPASQIDSGQKISPHGKKTTDKNQEHIMNLEKAQ